MGTLNIKERIQKMKDFFNVPVTDPAIPVVAPAAAAMMKNYMLADGVTEISVMQAGEKPAPGDAVTLNGQPAPDGTHVLTSGSSITTSGGLITAVVEVTAPVTEDLTNIPAPVVAPVVPVAKPPLATFEEAQKLIEKFFSGDADTRIANLEVVCRALMQNVMGYEIDRVTREASAAQAIEIYKAGLQNATTELKAASQQIAKHEKTITDLINLVSEIRDEPTADPKTLTGLKKEGFDRVRRRDEKFERIADALKTNKVLS